MSLPMLSYLAPGEPTIFDELLRERGVPDPSTVFAIPKIWMLGLGPGDPVPATSFADLLVQYPAPRFEQRDLTGPVTAEMLVRLGTPANPLWAARSRWRRFLDWLHS